ncbi:cell division protein DamX [Mangrovibacter phragmitis]|uniref:Cell division protein DamX n=1 Tax=Mangrovibacter phragmitis TaxID=1691903 RepID=A0A1B7L4M0_9ENTR|nr:cell division protein DamX [Mangrovibacter phragmitis]OAT77240.1 cell division protein DamX [Mangrovibacter phragmitis]
MDELKPEDGLKPDPSDRHPGRSRQSADYDNEPSINMDDVDVDADERRPSRSRRDSDAQEYDEADESGEQPTRRPPKRKKMKSAPSKGPVSRQHIMMGVGILVLLVLILGIGSALQSPKSPGDSSSTVSSGGEKSIDLSGSASQGSSTPAPVVDNNGQVAQGNSAPQEISVPPVSETPSQAIGPAQSANNAEQRVDVPGDLNTALTQQQGQINNVVAGSTLPTEPATVAPVNGKSSPVAAPERTVRHNEPAKTRREVVIEPSHSAREKTARAAEPAPVKTREPTPVVKKPEPVRAAPATQEHVAVAKTTPAPAAASGGTIGNINALKSAPGSHYTLQLSSSSNEANLSNWAKKEQLKDYVVYKTTRNGQPWYVLVSGIYANRDDAKRAVSSLPADVQAKNPWTKPIHQVQADLK